MLEERNVLLLLSRLPVLIVCCKFCRGMLDEVYVRIAENTKVKRPIEDTRLSLVLAREID